MDEILVAIDGSKRSKKVVGHPIEIAKRILKRRGERIRKQNVGCEEIWRIGNPTEFILETAESRKVSLIVVGVHTLHRLARIRALGSTTKRIAENSTVPVMVVP